MPRRSTPRSSDPSSFSRHDHGLGDGQARHVQERAGHHDQGQQQHRAHPVEGDEQAADHRGDQERQAGRRADQAVGAVTQVLGDEQRDQRGQRDTAQVARDHAEHQHHDEHPQQRAGRVAPRRLRDGQVDAEGDGVEDERRHGRRLDHHLLAVVVDDAAEPDAGAGGGHQEDARDQTGGEHRPGLEVGPEGDREPDREVRDRDDQRADQDVREHPLGPGAQVEARACRARGAHGDPDRSKPGNSSQVQTLRTSIALEVKRRPTPPCSAAAGHGERARWRRRRGGPMPAACPRRPRGPSPRCRPRRPGGHQGRRPR